MLQSGAYRTMNREQFIEGFYAENSGSDLSSTTSKVESSRLVTVKVNAVRIIQKCIKYSLGHCRFLSHGLRCHEWMVRFIGLDENAVMRYYALKLFKAMMPFLDQRWRSQESSMGIMSMITSSLRIGIHDHWRSFELKLRFEAAVKEHRERMDAPNHLELDPYYQWLALRQPQERDYADTCRNPFFVKDEYGVPRLEIVAPKEWAETMSDSCHRYHEWLLLQIKEDEREYQRQKEFIGMTTKERAEKKRADRSRRIDQGIRNVVIPKDFDARLFLKAYLKGNGDLLLRNMADQDEDEDETKLDGGVRKGRYNPLHPMPGDYAWKRGNTKGRWKTPLKK